MNDLQKDRLYINEKPFLNTGIDFFEPVLLKFSEKQKQKTKIIIKTQIPYKGKTWWCMQFLHA